MTQFSSFLAVISIWTLLLLGPITLAPSGEPIHAQLSSSVDQIEPGTNFTLSCQLDGFEPKDTDYFKVHFRRRTGGSLATYDYYPEFRFCWDSFLLCPYMNFHPNTSEPALSILESQSSRWAPIFEVSLFAHNSTPSDAYYCQLESGESKFKSNEVQINLKVAKEPGNGDLSRRITQIPILLLVIAFFNYLYG